MGPQVSRREGDLPLVLLEAASPREEARLIARQIETLVGGLDHRSLEDDEPALPGPGIPRGL